MTITQAVQRAPTLTGKPVLGSMSELRRDYLGAVSRAAREVGGLARIVAGPPGWRTTFYSVSSPELVAEILSQPDRFRKNAPGYRELRQALGNNMLTSEDEVWRRQRRFLAPIFTHRRISTSYAEIMVDEAEHFAARQREGSGEILDAYPAMIEVASRVIGRILFGADMTRAMAQISRFKLINDALLMRAVAPHAVPRWLPTPANRRLDAELAAFRAVVDDIIADRKERSANGSTNDMLALLLAARDAESPSDRLGDAEVTDQALLFLIAGYDTSAMTLACTLVELARSPQWQTTLRDELHGVLNGRPLTADDLPRLPWLGRVVRECMRLYPAAHGMARSTRQEEVLSGYRIPAGSWLEVSPWGVHHSPAVWPDPLRFDPRRFDVADGEFPGGHRYAWFPFGAGPRACVGMQLALLEIQIVLATILQSFRVTTTLTSTPVHAAITLQPTGALPLQLHPIDAPAKDRAA